MEVQAMLEAKHRLAGPYLGAPSVVRVAASKEQLAQPGKRHMVGGHGA